MTLCQNILLVLSCDVIKHQNCLHLFTSSLVGNKHNTQQVGFVLLLTVALSQQHRRYSLCGCCFKKTHLLSQEEQEAKTEEEQFPDPAAQERKRSEEAEKWRLHQLQAGASSEDNANFQVAFYTVCAHQTAPATTAISWRQWSEIISKLQKCLIQVLVHC